MSMGKRVRERQPEMWVAATNFPTAASHPFYTRLNQRLDGWATVKNLSGDWPGESRFLLLRSRLLTKSAMCGPPV